MRTIAFYCFFLLALGPASANPDSLAAAAFLSRAQALLTDEQTDSAVYYTQQSLVLFKQNNDLENWLNVYVQMAWIWRTRLEDPEKAIDLYTEAQKNIWRKPSTPAEQIKLAKFYIQAGYTYSIRMGDYLNGKICYERSNQIYDLYPANQDTMTARFLYHEIGNIYTRLGEYDKALVFLNKAGKILLRAGKNNEVGEIYNDVGIVYRSKGDPNSAIREYLKGISLPLQSHFVKGLLSNSLATDYLVIRQYDRALQYINQAQQEINQSLATGEDDRARQHLLGNWETLGMIYAAQKKYAASEDALLQALRLAEEVYADNPNRREIGKIFISLGNVYADWGYLDDGLCCYHEALRRVLPNFRSDDPATLPENTAVYAENTILEALAGKAEIFEKMGLLRKQNGFLDQALACYDLIWEVEGRLRDAYQYETSEIIALNESRLRLEQGLQDAFTLYTQTRDGKYLETAFRLSERGKSLLLLEGLKTNKALTSGNIPDSLVQLQHNLKVQIAMYERELYEEQGLADQADPAQVETLQSSIDQLRNSLKQLEQHLNAYPVYAKQTAAVKTQTIAQVQRQLGRDKSSLVEYFEGATHLYVFVLGADKASLSALPVGSLKKWVTTFRLGLERRNEDFIEPALQLYNYLWKPFEKDIQERVMIIPDGVLGYVPFDALLSQKPVNPNRPHTFEYLLKKYRMSYCYSATLLKEMRDQGRRMAGGELIAFAPEFPESKLYADAKRHDQRRMFGPLKYNAAEVAAIHQLIGGEIFSGKEASMAHFLERAGRYRIIHLSTHGKANDANGMYSCLAFTSEKGIDTCYAADLQTLRLRADMVVLSACETGVGELQRGEGIISLARSFAYAGAGSVVNTLWSINDESTAQLMELFYKNIRSGLPKDEALYRAKLAFIESNDGKAHPTFWAAFIPVGDMDPIEFGLPWYWTAIPAGLVLLVLVLVFRRKGKSSTP